MTSTAEDLSIKALFLRVLHNASKVFNLPASQEENQQTMQSALSDLRIISTCISSLHLFSSNETLDDVTTHDLVFMSVPYVYAEVEMSMRVSDPKERQLRLRTAEAHLRAFASLLNDYQVVPEAEKNLYGQKSPNVSDPMKRRELKINQFKKERELSTRIKSFIRKGDTDSDDSNIFGFIALLLSSTSIQNDDFDQSEDDGREAVEILLRLLWAKAAMHSESISQELSLLQNMPFDTKQDTLLHSPPDATWKIDIPALGTIHGRKGPLLDVNGKPLRPFTILPSSEDSRSRLHAEVFQSDHRLPTMSIDEYLDEERKRGNIISGGGPQSMNSLTKTNELLLNSENDGMTEAEEKAEEQRWKNELWARFKEENPRGAGNTMNRG